MNTCLKGKSGHSQAVVRRRSGVCSNSLVCFLVKGSSLLFLFSFCISSLTNWFHVSTLVDQFFTTSLDISTPHSLSYRCSHQVINWICSFVQNNGIMVLQKYPSEQTSTVTTDGILSPLKTRKKARVFISDYAVFEYWFSRGGGGNVAGAALHNIIFLVFSFLLMFFYSLFSSCFPFLSLLRLFHHYHSVSFTFLQRVFPYCVYLG